MDRKKPDISQVHVADFCLRWQISEMSGQLSGMILALIATWTF
ncbi:MAG: hypothetical protein U9R15_02935 [Chloroflexota bacterium]|nr:hypothetical protein [Chloroflexota bacterium]